jgi:hypothetical protein
MSEVCGNNPDWQLIPASAIKKTPLEPVSWDVESLLQADDGPACWFGDSGSYKSWLALHVAACVSMGEPAFGKFPTKERARVVYVNLDAGARSFERRVRQLPAVGAGLHIVTAESWNAQAFEKILSENPGSFIILDCWTDVYEQPMNVDMAHHMRESIKWFRDAYKHYGANGIVIDHSKRAQARSALRGADLIYGSTQKKGSWRQMALIEKVALPEFTPNHARVKFTCVKMSESEEFRPFFIDLAFDEPLTCDYAELLMMESDRQTKTECHFHQIVAYLKEQAPKRLSAREIAEALGVQRNSRAFSDALQAAMKTGSVKSFGGGRSTKYAYIDRLDFDIPDTLTTAGI